MRVLFTGASSFTGAWFTQALAEAGHDVVATFRGQAGDYSGVRAERVRLVQERCLTEFGVGFGEERFLAILRGERWDLLCHHAAEVKDYKNPDFDVCAALAANTRNARAVFEAFADAGGRRIIATGSVFEPGEGAGEEPLRAFSPYGLSKGLTWQVLRHFAHEARVRLGKFVIPNPFGPWEEPRFTSYLARSWFAGETATVATPRYVRDNIHVRLLAAAYAAFAGRSGDAPGVERFAPCGYPESQGAFTLRFARELRPRLRLPCAVRLGEQAEFPEPRVRINTDVLDEAALGFREAEAWEELADFYRTAFGR